MNVQVLNVEKYETEAIDPVDYIDEWLMFKDAKTRSDYRRGIEKFIHWNKDATPSPKRLNEYKHELILSGLKVNSINTYLAPVKDFFGWLYESSYTGNDPSKGLTRVKHQDTNKINKARELTDEEINKLFSMTSKATLKDHCDRLYLLLIFNLGLRNSEALGLKVSDLELDEGHVSILGKGSKRRTLGINDLLREELIEYLKGMTVLTGEDFIIQSSYFKSGKVNTKRAANNHGHRIIKKYADMAGLEDVKTHSGRVTAINILLNSEVSTRDVANFAGHSSVSTTMVYDRKDVKRTVQVTKMIEIGKEK